MSRLLLITSTFPPFPGNSSEKMGTRVKHLYEHGWETTVLTPAIPGSVRREPNMVPGMPPVEVARTPFLFQESRPSFRDTRGVFLTGRRDDWLDALYVPNGYVRWLPFAVARGISLAARADLVVSFNNPTMTHLIGYLVSRAARKPWVAALRDPISGNPIHRAGPELFNRWVERLVVRAADQVVQWGDFVAEPLSARYPDRPPDRFTVIPYTGYNPDDFAGRDLSPPPFQRPLKIAYTGSFYPGQITPEPLLRALGRLHGEGRIAPGDLQVTFAGDWDDGYTQLTGELGVEGYLHALGTISRAACVDLWLDSHALLVILGAGFDSPDRFPAKFWDYVGARRFILGLVPPEGRLARLIRRQRLGLVAPPRDEAEIAEAVLELLDRLDRGTLLPQPDESFLDEEANRACGERQFARTLHDALARNQDRSR